MDLNVIILVCVGVILIIALINLHLKLKMQKQNWTSGNQNEALKYIDLLRDQFPLPVDQAAVNRIEEKVRIINRQFSTNTSIAPKKVYEKAADLTREIAATYYPDADDPILQASVADLLLLNERIVTRLNQKIGEFPLNTIKDINIQKIIRGKDYYDLKIKNKLEWIKKYKALYKIGNHAWLSYNMLNPWYWGRRFAYTSARELTFRYLLTWILTIVGEEAMAVYSRRDINTREAAFERDMAFAMIDETQKENHISKEAYALILDHVLNKTHLNDTAKVNILRALTIKKSGDRISDTAAYTDEQKRLLKENLQRIANLSE